MTLREKLEIALAKPIPLYASCEGDPEYFDPWEDIIQGIYGDYSSQSDELMIAAIKAVRDKTTFELIKDWGFSIEFALYVLAGHGLLNYGTSPRGGWPHHEIEDLWQPLIDKWEAYAEAVWSTDRADQEGE